jgi:hypothetical protein
MQISRPTLEYFVGLEVLYELVKFGDRSPCRCREKRGSQKFLAPRFPSPGGWTPRTKIFEMRCVPSNGPPNGKRKFRREAPETFTNVLTRFAPLHKKVSKKRSRIDTPPQNTNSKPGSAYRMIQLLPLGGATYH